MKTILSILALVVFASADYQAVYYYEESGCSSDKLMYAVITTSTSCIAVDCYEYGSLSYKTGCPSSLSFPLPGVVYNYYSTSDCSGDPTSTLWYKNDYCPNSLYYSYHCDYESGNITYSDWSGSDCTGTATNYTYEPTQCTFNYVNLTCSTISNPSSDSSATNPSSDSSATRSKYMTTYLYSDSSCSDSGLMGAMAYEVDGSCTPMPCQPLQETIPGISYMKVACENTFSDFPEKGILVQPYEDDQCATDPIYEVQLWYKNDWCLMGMNFVCDESTDTFTAKNWSNTDCSGTTTHTVIINSGSCYEGSTVTCLYNTGTSVLPSKQFFLTLFSVLLFIFFKIK